SRREYHPRAVGPGSFPGPFFQGRLDQAFPIRHAHIQETGKECSHGDDDHIFHRRGAPAAPASASVLRFLSKQSFFHGLHFHSTALGQCRGQYLNRNQMSGITVKANKVLPKRKLWVSDTDRQKSRSANRAGSRRAAGRKKYAQKKLNLSVRRGTLMSPLSY